MFNVLMFLVCIFLPGSLSDAINPWPFAFDPGQILNFAEFNKLNYERSEPVCETKKIKKDFGLRIRHLKYYKDGLDTKIKHHVVKAGENLSTIAKIYGCSLADLRHWNLLGKAKPGPGTKLIILDQEIARKLVIASWYGRKFQGRTMANLQSFDKNKLSIAHRTLPLGQFVRVTNLANGKSLVVPVLDRGPYVKSRLGFTREIDVSEKVADLLEFIKKGRAAIILEPLARCSQP
jgi:hypothetical protein